MSSFTTEQAEQAIRKKFFDDLQKHFALWHREQAIKFVYELHLPYRIALDYVKAIPDHERIPLNKWYPYPKEPINAKLEPWYFSTDEGKALWEKYFTVYLVPYEDAIPTYNSFNMFGDTDHTNEQVQERIAYYINAIQRYKNDTQGWYDKEPRKKQVSDYETCDFLKGYLLPPGTGFYMWDGETAPKHPQALQIMQYEKALCERAIVLEKQDYEKRKKQYTELLKTQSETGRIPIEPHETDYTGEILKRINAIIDKLEREK